MGLLLEATQPTSPASTHGSEVAGLLQVLLALVLVSGLAYVVLRALAKRGFGRLPAHGPLEVEHQLPLDRQSGLLVVRVEGRRLLLSTHRDAPPRLLTELEPSSSAAGPRT